MGKKDCIILKVTLDGKIMFFAAAGVIEEITYLRWGRARVHGGTLTQGCGNGIIKDIWYVLRTSIGCER